MVDTAADSADTVALDAFLSVRTGLPTATFARMRTTAPGLYQAALQAHRAAWLEYQAERLEAVSQPDPAAHLRASLQFVGGLALLWLLTCWTYAADACYILAIIAASALLVTGLRGIERHTEDI